MRTMESMMASVAPGNRDNKDRDIRDADAMGRLRRRTSLPAPRDRLGAARSCAGLASAAARSVQMLDALRQSATSIGDVSSLSIWTRSRSSRARARTLRRG